MYNFNEMTTEEYEALKEQIKKDSARDGKLSFEKKIEVRPLGNNRFEVIDGHHKIKVARELDFLEIPDDQIEILDLTEAQALERLMKLKTRGSLINPIKQAEAFQKLRDYGMSEEQIGLEFGLSQSRVADIIARLKIPEQVKERIVSDVRYFTPSLVDEISRFEDIDQKRVVDYIIEQESKGIPVTVQELREDRTGKKDIKGQGRPKDFTGYSEDMTMRQHSSIMVYQPQEVNVKNNLLNEQEIECPCCHRWFLLNVKNKKILN